MEFGLFNSACVLPQFNGDEHRRIMDEVAIVQDRRPRPASSTRGRPSTTSSRSTRTSRPTRCSSATSRRRRRLDPHRFRHLQRHAAGEPPGPRRRARRDARPPLRGALRVRHGPRLVDDRAEGLRHHRSRPHRARCSTRSSASSARCGSTRTTRASTASSSRCRRATCLPKPYSAPHPPMWVAAGNPVDVHEGRAHGPRRAVLHDRRAGVGEAARRALQERDRQRGAGRRLRERQHHGHHAVAVPRRRPARPQPRRRPGHGLPPQPLVALPRHVPAPGRHPRMAGAAARSHARRDRRVDQGRRHAVRHAGRGRDRDPQVRRRRCRPGRVRPAVVDAWNAISRTRRSRRSASTCCRCSTRIPCTARRGSAKPRRRRAG